MAKEKTLRVWGHYVFLMKAQQEDGVCVPLHGGVPKHPEVMKAFLSAREAKKRRKEQLDKDAKDGVLPPTRTTPEIEAELKRMMGVELWSAEELKEDFLKSWTGFRNHDGALMHRGADVRAHIKSCADALTDLMQTQLDLAQFASKVRNNVYVHENFLKIRRRDDLTKFVTEPDDSPQYPITIMTPQGKRTTIKVTDIVNDWAIICILKVRDITGKRPITRDRLVDMFDYGCTQGFGSDRGMGYGRYEYELSEEVDTLKEAEAVKLAWILGAPVE